MNRLSILSASLMVMLTAMCLSLGSCSKDSDSTIGPGTITPGTGDGGDEKKDTTTTDSDSKYYSNDPAPTDWTSPTASGNTYPTSMNVILDESGAPCPINDGDIMAAFINGSCHGVDTVYTGTDKYTRVQLKVFISEEESKKDYLKVEFRYYSPKYKHLYIANPITYEDGVLGAYRNGYKPVWK